MSAKKPPWRMVVGINRLDPADPYTEERLDHYKRGTVLEVRVVNEKTKPEMTRYHAILSTVIEKCPTIYQTTDELDDALKLKLGVVDSVATIGGANTILRYPGSLTKLDDEGMQAFFVGAMALLQRMTGVDPLTLWKESPADQPDATALESPVEDRNVPDPNADAGDHPESAPPVNPSPGSSRPAADAGDVKVPSSSPASAVTTGVTPQDCVRQLMALARDPDLQVEVRLEELKKAEKNWRAALPDSADWIGTVVKTCEKVANNTLQGPSAQAYLYSTIKGD